MKKKICFVAFICVAVCIALSSCVSAPGTTESIHSLWRPLPTSQKEGLLAERLELWRKDRLWYVSDSGYLLSGYEFRPGIHPWQGEHVGKWLHAATLAYKATGDEKLGDRLHETVRRLLATQLPNGYLGTYAEKKRFYSRPADKGSWDVWSHRYNLYGLLTYERFNPSPKVVKACERMADLLIEVYGPEKTDLTQNGTRKGISSTTLLESMMMLYERTRQERFLKFAEHIVQCSENAPRLRLVDSMLKQQDVSIPGEGKAYQLMANLLGYLMLYENTGQERYLMTVRNAWENIRARHIYTTGGPWSRHMPYNANTECFARSDDFAADIAVVETCSTTTWIQLNLHLLKVTGQAKYAIEAEKAVFNALIAAQYPEGVDWCYYTKANQGRRPFEGTITCCASSGPRALEMFSRYLIGQVDGGVSLTTLTPCTATLPEKFGNAKIKITGNYPFNSSVGIRFEKANDKNFALEFRAPADTGLESVRINDQHVALTKNDRGFYLIRRTWKAGDRIAIEFQYLLNSHLETPKNGQRSVAFTYGPWALAQTIDEGAVVTEPFIGKDVRSKPASQWLEPYTTKDAAAPGFRIRNTNIILGPFYSAADNNTGIRTYFKF